MQVAALEAQLSSAAGKVPGHYKRQLREVRAQLEVLRSRNLQLREAVRCAAPSPALRERQSNTGSGGHALPLGLMLGGMPRRLLSP